MQTCYAKWWSTCSGYCEFNVNVNVSFVVFCLFLFVCLCYHSMRRIKTNTMTYQSHSAWAESIQLIILYYYNIVYYIHIHSLWFSNTLRPASSRSASASDAVCLSRVYDVMTMPLTTRVIQMYQLFHPQNGSSDPLHILHRVSYGWPPKTLKFSWKSDD